MNGKKQKEQRAFAGELRVDGGGDGKEGTQRTIRGHAAVFNAPSEDLGGFREIIEPGAFTGALGDDVRALLNHNPDFVLGRTRAGTLRLAEDAKGLAIEIDPPDTQTARDLLVSIQRGDINQMSFGFWVVSDRWEKKDGENIRYVEEVRLFDVSPVTFPAYPQTDVGVRSLADVAAAGAAVLASKEKSSPGTGLRAYKQRLMQMRQGM